MSVTAANHGAFLLQLTTLIVPILQSKLSWRTHSLSNSVDGDIRTGWYCDDLTQDPGSTTAAGINPDKVLR
jgi:hypothetical protein